MARDLERLIDDGTLIGRLPPETDLAESYAVARVTVRRAIQSLVESGKLQVVHGRGTYVRVGPARMRLIAASWAACC